MKIDDDVFYALGAETVCMVKARGPNNDAAWKGGFFTFGYRINGRTLTYKCDEGAFMRVPGDTGVSREYDMSKLDAVQL